MPWEEFAFGMMAMAFFTALPLGVVYFVRATKKDKTAVSPGNIQKALERIEERSGLLADGLERVAELDRRVLDLEERVDFAERMLTRERARDHLPDRGV